MGTKNNPSKFDCYDKLDPDEPYFVLMGRDPSAPDLVLLWARERELAIQRGEKPESHREKVKEAQDCALAMRIWKENQNLTGKN